MKKFEGQPQNVRREKLIFLHIMLNTFTKCLYLFSSSWGKTKTYFDCNFTFLNSLCWLNNSFPSGIVNKLNNSAEVSWVERTWIAKIQMQLFSQLLLWQNNMVSFYSNWPLYHYIYNLPWSLYSEKSFSSTATQEIKQEWEA